MVKFFLSLGVFTFLIAGFLAVGPPAEPVYACDGYTNFFGLPPWHAYIPCDGNGVSQDINLNQIWLIGVAVLESILRVVSIASVFMIAWGGFKYITSQGSPEGTKSAQKTIQTAIIGLGISVFAAIIVSATMRLLGGSSLNLVNGLPNNPATQSVTRGILSFIYALAGAVSALYVAIGAVRYTMANGEPNKISQAKNTILYAVIGVVVVLMANAITGLVLNRLG